MPQQGISTQKQFDICLLLELNSKANFSSVHLFTVNSRVVWQVGRSKIEKFKYNFSEYLFNQITYKHDLVLKITFFLTINLLLKVGVRPHAGVEYCKCDRDFESSWECLTNV